MGNLSGLLARNTFQVYRLLSYKLPLIHSLRLCSVPGLQNMIPQFQSYCQMWSSDVAQISNDSDRITYFREHLPELLLDHETVRAIITQMAKGKKWPDLRQSGIFNHEVLLYLDPSRRFSVRVYFHPPQSHTDIHDHTSWGISGTPFGRTG